VQVPWTNFLTVVLRKHHRVVHLASIVHLFEFFRRLDIERFNDYFGSGAVLFAIVSTLFLLLRAIYVVLVF